MKPAITDEAHDVTEVQEVQDEIFLRMGELRKYTVEWSKCMRVSPRGGMVYFGHFLARNKQFDDLVDGCPLTYKSNNAPKKRSVLGTLVCGLLEGARRYAHLSRVMNDKLSAEALGIEDGFVSEDSVRRGLKKVSRENWEACERWLFNAERSAVLPVLTERYVLDLDTSVKPVYGHQEGAEIGYNPTKPGRPSQSLHVGFIGLLRLLVHMQVHGGKKHAACHMASGIWAWVDSLPTACKPYLIRGDIGYGNEGYMSASEKRNLWYLFKLKISGNVRKLILKLASKTNSSWRSAPATDYQFLCSKLKLMGWSKKRSVIVLRRPRSLAKKRKSSRQPDLPLFDLKGIEQHWEYAVLVHHSELPVESIPKLYQDRADCENVLDELKNQWGLGGFSTRDLKRVNILARLGTLVCNWWNVFARIGEPSEHMEALTSRPEFLHLMAQAVSHGGKQVIRFTSHHENSPHVERAFSRIHQVFSWIESIAEQLSKQQAWAVQLSIAFYVFLNGKVLNVPDIAQEGIRKLAPPPLCGSP